MQSLVVGKSFCLLQWESNPRFCVSSNEHSILLHLLLVIFLWPAQLPLAFEILSLNFLSNHRPYGCFFLSIL